MTAPHSNHQPQSVRSMTGFGAASRETGGFAVRVEARSVNNRGLTISVRAPSFLDAQSAAIEAGVKRRCSRGTVAVAISIQRARNAAPSRIASAVVADYAEQASILAEELGMHPPSLGDLLRLPGALEDAPAADATEAELATVVEAVDAALDEMIVMRDREGASLAAELRSLVAQLEDAAGRVEARAPAAVLVQRDKLRERLSQLLVPGQTIPDDLIAREIAVLADRTDVAEEVARLRSHVSQWREALDQGGAVGRRLDFLTQELGREANTVGSKCQDAETTRIVVEMKVAVERLKEQTANLE
ncbi:MAG: YicC family protein [Planctomycetes bacterium]|nr:YicC family protein [Planctomycetota bacterium]